jgi:hypothetical protein
MTVGEKLRRRQLQQQIPFGDDKQEKQRLIGFFAGEERIGLGWLLLGKELHGVI